MAMKTNGGIHFKGSLYSNFLSNPCIGIVLH